MSSHSSCLLHCHQPDTLSLQSNLEKQKLDSDDKSEGKEGKKHNRIQWGKQRTMRQKIIFFSNYEKSTEVQESIPFLHSNTAEYVAAVRGCCLTVCLTSLILPSCTTTLTYYTAITVNLTQRASAVRCTPNRQDVFCLLSEYWALQFMR